MQNYINEDTIKIEFFHSYTRYTKGLKKSPHIELVFTVKFRQNHLYFKGTSSSQGIDLVPDVRQYVCVKNASSHCLQYQVLDGPQTGDVFNLYSHYTLQM